MLMRKLILAVTLGLVSVSSHAGNSSHDCMAKAIYYESRGGSDKDMQSIGLTIMNRVKSGTFPDSVCGVVKQKHQFSPNIRNGAAIREKSEYEKSLSYSRKIISGGIKDFTNGAQYFHTPAVNPNWSRRFKQVYRNGQHIFYKP